MQETAFARDRKVRLPVAGESRRSALHRTKRILAPCMVVERSGGGRREWASGASDEMLTFSGIQHDRMRD